MASKNNVLYTGVQIRQNVRERLWVKHWTTSSAFSQKMTTSWKVMNLSLFWQQNPYLHEEKKLLVGYRFLVNECLCEASCLGKSGGFGTCRTNSLVIITPTSQRLHFSWNLVCWVGHNFLWSCSIPRKRSVQAECDASALISSQQWFFHFHFLPKIGAGVKHGVHQMWCQCFDISLNPLLSILCTAFQQANYKGAFKILFCWFFPCKEGQK